MSTNKILPFGIGTGANAWDDTVYDGSDQQQTGIQKGIVPSGLMTKAWRQATVPASALGQIIVDHGLVDATDDSAANFKANFRMALAAMLASAPFAVDQSTTANIITASLDPAPPTISIYRGVFIRVANTNTGPVTFSLNALGSRAVVKKDGSPLVAKDLKGGQFAHFIYDLLSGQWVLASLAPSDLIPIIAANAITPATANVTVYVYPSGNDTTGDGSMASPFATIARAVQYGTSRYSFAGFRLIVQLSPGTYASPGPIIGVPNLTIQGDLTGSNIGAYTISGSGSPGSFLIGPSSGVQMNLSGVQVINTGTTAGNVAAIQGGSIVLTYVVLGATVAATSNVLVAANGGGTVTVGAGCQIGNVNFGSAFSAGTGGGITLTSSLAIGGAPNFAQAFVFATTGGSWTTLNGSTFTGAVSSVTGPRYLQNLFGTINTGGAGTNYFPGNAAGSAAQAAAYV
jgi:hypothetical protein